MRPHSELKTAISAAARSLAAAGIDSAQVDAELLAAHVAGVDRGRLAVLDVPGPPDFEARYRDLVDARARRIPLQHLTGLAPFGPLMLHVGPGVFIPRPETEAMLEWCMKALADQQDPMIVDLCTGSGALAVALARHRPDATVVAVDDSPVALGYATRNAAGTSVQVVEADITAPDAGRLRPDLDGRVDLLVCNPPYIPEAAELEPEVAGHDPHHALFGGPDGMAVIPAVVALAVRWLRPGGVFAVEHDDTTSAQTVELITRTGLFDDVTARADLAGRPRFVTATRQESERNS
ncbi:MAG: peptide chain release factor N(5)-glutamine methyltransferase [Mycobacterium sp.]